MEDCDEKSGAFEYCPGTHWEGKYRANYYLKSGLSIRDIPNDVPTYRILNPVTLSAKSGDLLIFNTDGFHRGGIISKGKSRSVIRGDTERSNNRGTKILFCLLQRL